jgi:hypothetical protein
MTLKSPGIVTFTLAVVLTVLVLATRFFGAQIPVITGNEFWGLLAAHMVLVTGCVIKGL